MGGRITSCGRGASWPAFAEATANGVLDREVEVVVREVQGAPFGMVSATRDAFRDLTGPQGCLAILGPFMPPAAAAVAAEVNQFGVPTLSYAGTDAFAGEFCFNLAHSSLSDEGPFLADVLRRQGAKKIAVIREDNFWGDECIGQLRLRARELGLQLFTEQVVSTFAKTADVGAALRVIQALDTDAIVYFGAGFAIANVIEAINAAGKLPRIIFNSAFDMLTPELDGTQQSLPDIAGISQIHERNATLQAMLDRFEKRYGRRPSHVFAALGYDLAHMLALGLSQARPHSCDGLKQALEKIRRIPTAVGVPGTHMGFLPWDHHGHKGGYMLREIRGGKSQPIDMPTALIA